MNKISNEFVNILRRLIYMKVILKNILIIAIFVLTANAQNLGELIRKMGVQRVFTYTKGEKTWSNHIDTKITTTFEELINNNRFVKRLVCKADRTEFEKKPFRRIGSVCMQGHGATMVIPLGYPTWSYEVVVSPETRGLFEQKHMTGGIPSHYYNASSKSDTKYFLLPFEDYEIPVYSIEKPQLFLPMWKRFFMKENQMGKEYFDSHIRIIGSYVRDFSRDSIHWQYWYVVYYFYVDWAKIRLQDGFLISYESTELADLVDASDYSGSFERFQDKLPEGFLKYVRKKITHLKLIDSVVSKDKIVETVISASPLLGFNVNKDIRLSPRGELKMKLWGTVDWEANKCLQAEIELENGKISPVSEAGCRIY